MGFPGDRLLTASVEGETKNRTHCQYYFDIVQLHYIHRKW
jgi:hypothetical protein